MEKIFKFNKQINLILELTPFYTPKQAKAGRTILKVENSPNKLNENFANEIRNDEENINSEIFRKYFGYPNPSSLAKGLLIASQVKSNDIENQAIFSINELRNAVIRKEVPENPNVNPNKIIGIAEKFLNFNNQQKGKRLKILTFKQILQRLPIAPAQVKASNTSENVINEIRQIIFFSSSRRNY